MAEPEISFVVPQRPIDRLIEPIKVFSSHKTAGAILLMAATLIAIIWANSPWSTVYDEIRHTMATIGIGGFHITKPILLWVNDGFMSVFFFVVGLEIKREVLAGELTSPRKAALPALAALGGMVLPAGIYAIFNISGAGSAGWGIPMATDIAFALGALSLLGDRTPTAAKVFLTALAIADDIGAVLVIAVFYTDSISLFSLLIGGLVFGLAIIANLSGIRNPMIYLILGVIVWTAFLKSGVHATIAAVLMAFTIPARTRIDESSFLKRMNALIAGLQTSGASKGDRILSEAQQQVIEEMAECIEKRTAPVQRLEHSLAPLVTFLILPVFALANAGVSFKSGVLTALAHPVSIGIIAGLFIGKQLGILLFSYLAIRTGLAEMPDGVSWLTLHGVSILGGVGFTMSLFVASLAFSDGTLIEASKAGILGGSLLSAGFGLVLLYLTLKRQPP